MPNAKNTNWANLKQALNEFEPDFILEREPQAEQKRETPIQGSLKGENK